MWEWQGSEGLMRGRIFSGFLLLIETCCKSQIKSTASLVPTAATAATVATATLSATTTAADVVSFSYFKSFA